MIFKANTDRLKQVPPPEKLLTYLREAERILLIGHQHPDGDALGSALALGLALKTDGHQVTVGYSGTFPLSLNFLAIGKDFLRRVEFSPDLAEKYDLLVLVDCITPFRVWPACENHAIDCFPPFVAIDHHAEHHPSHHRAGYVNARAAATGELIFKILEALNYTLTPPIVEALLTALISDTGSFSQANTTSECLRQAAVLISLGGDIEYINHFLKRNWSMTRMRLLTTVLETIQLHQEGRLATMILTQDMLNMTGSSLAEAEGLVEYPLLLSGVDMVAFLKVNGEGKTRVSLRGRPGVDVREIARSQGGGGHKQAAAYLDDSPYPETALERLLALMAALERTEKTA
jgi:phosphoesterase RecJ-like protein